MYKVLLISQIPPPYHGQSIMQKYLSDAKWDWCNKKHIRLDFSENINEVGKFRIKKIYSLIKIVFKILLERINGRIDIVYYPPASPNKIAFYRDMFLLPFIRISSKEVIFHFHSGGFNLLPKKLNLLELIIAKIIYNKPTLAITLLLSLSKEVEWINPKRIINIPNGIVDVFDYQQKRNDNNYLSILFVGNLIEEKGILYLIEAINIIKSDSPIIKVNFIGGWRDKRLKELVETKILEENLSDIINVLGIKENDEKWNYFYTADIFCLPTYETEAMPVTLLEAMMFELPIITTNWRAIPDIVADGEEGFLVPIKSPEAIAEKIKILIKNPALCITMGKKGREKFLKEYTLEKHLEGMEIAFETLLQNQKF